LRKKLTSKTDEIAIGLESVAEVFANRYLIKLCSDLIEGKAAIKAIENKLEPKRVTRKPTYTRPPKSSHTSARTRTEDECDRKRAGNPNCKRRKKSARTTTEISDQLQGRTTSTITLDCDEYPQPCWHYSSVIKNNPHSVYVTWPYGPEVYSKRPAVIEWNKEHNRNLVDADIECQADEWPAARYIEVNDGYKNLEGHGNRVPKDEKRFIRLLSQAQNGAAGQKFKGCPQMARREDVQTEISLEAPARGGNMYTE
jgi:chitinase